MELVISDHLRPETTIEIDVERVQRLSTTGPVDCPRFSLSLQPRSSQWCWAAVAVGIAGSYDSTFRRCQCQVVSQVLGEKEKKCCAGIVLTDCEKADTEVAACDEPRGLKAGLRATMHLDESDPMQHPPLGADDVARALSSCRFICLRRKQGGGHFVAIGDFVWGDDGRLRVTLGDPLNGWLYKDYEKYRAKCDYSYRTQ